MYCGCITCGTWPAELHRVGIFVGLVTAHASLAYESNQKNSEGDTALRCAAIVEIKAWVRTCSPQAQPRTVAAALAMPRWQLAEAANQKSGSHNVGQNSDIGTWPAAMKSIRTKRKMLATLTMASASQPC